MDKPIRPDRPTTLPETVRPGTRPGLENRPGISTLPGIANRPGGGTQPGLDRPWRPENGARPWQPGRPGDWRPGQLPSWANRPGVTQVNNNWVAAINRPSVGNWTNIHPERVQTWNRWGNTVRNNWHYHPDHNQWFHGDWWNNHFNDGFHYNHWHYGWCFDRHPWQYWWTVPTFVGLTNWFTWSAPATAWQTPVYYDYGQGGNITYNNSTVYVDGQSVGSTADFAASAANLTAVDPPPSETAAEEAEWMPLGTFAVSSNTADAEPQRIVQLAVNKQGVVSGTLYNTATDAAQTLLGQVDKSSQRVAIRIGESNVVAETGLYNLTQNEAPLLVHFGSDRQETWLLVRLETPSDEPAP